MEEIHSPENSSKRLGYLILIQARLNGQSGNEADKARRYGLPEKQIHNLAKGRIDNFSLVEIAAVARKIGITARP